MHFNKKFARARAIPVAISVTINGRKLTFLQKMEIGMKIFDKKIEIWMPEKSEAIDFWKWKNAIITPDGISWKKFMPKYDIWVTVATSDQLGHIVVINGADNYC